MFFMRPIVAMAFVISASFSANAGWWGSSKKKSVQFNGELLTWGQLSSLSAKKRIQYLQEVGQLLVLMEKMQGNIEVADNSEFNEMKDKVAFLLRMMAVFPQAYAEDQETSSSSVGSAPQPEAGVPFYKDGQFRCAGQDLEFDPQLGTCAKVRSWRNLKKPRPLSSFWHVPGTCGDGFVPVSPTEGGQQKCIPKRTFEEVLSPAQQRDLKKGRWFNAGYFDGETPQSVGDSVWGTDKFNSDGTRKNGQAPTSAGASGGAQQPPEPPSQADQTVSCERPKLACESMSSEELARHESKFNSARKVGAPCIVGGFFSRYETSRRCKAVSSIKVGPNTLGCKNSKDNLCNPLPFCLGMKVDDKLQEYFNKQIPILQQQLKDTRDKKKQAQIKATITTYEKIPKNAYKVEGSDDRVINIRVCERVVDSKTQQTDMTNRCEGAVKDYIAGGRSMFGGNGIGEKYTSCDFTKLEGYPGRDEWTKLREDFKQNYEQNCSDEKAQKEFQAKFCKECAIISERIMAMNEKAVGKPCVSAGIPPAPAGGQPSAPGAPEAISEKPDESG